MNDKCYICFDNEGTLNKTCINRKCNAMTHSSCIQEQYITLKKCGLCRSNIIIQPDIINPIKFLFMTSSFVLKTYLVFFIITGFNPFDNITYIIDYIINYIIYNIDNRTSIAIYNIYSYTHVALVGFFLFNYFIHLDILHGGSESIREYNHKYGACGTILLLYILEIIISIICRVIGYSINKILFHEIYNFHTSEIFLLGFLCLLSGYVLVFMYKNLFPFHL